MPIAIHCRGVEEPAAHTGAVVGSPSVSRYSIRGCPATSGTQGEVYFQIRTLSSQDLIVRESVPGQWHQRLTADAHAAAKGWCKAVLLLISCRLACPWY